MTAAATGTQLLSALGREREFTVPDLSDLEYYRPVLPVGGGLQRSENARGSVNSSGYRERGVPGAIEGPYDWGHRLTSGELLTILEHVLGVPVKSEPQTGVFQYVFSGDDSGGWTTLFGILGLLPVERSLDLGIAAGAFSLEFGENNPIVLRLVDAQQAHGTPLGLPVEHGSADGSYTSGPWFRGIIRNRGLGAVWVQVTSVVDGLQVQVHQTTGEPTFPSPAITLPYDGATGRQYYTSLQGAVTLPGTVTVGAASATVTGTGVDFEEYEWLAPGVIVDIDGEQIAVLTVDSATQITLAANHTAGATDVEITAIRRDIGWLEENKDLLEVIFPGTRADHLAQLSSALTGTVEITGTTVTGTGTAFTSEMAEGDVLIAGGVERVVDTITSDTAVTLATAHPGVSAGASARRLAVTTDLTGTVEVAGTAVTGSGTAFSSEILAGETIRVAGEDAVVASVDSDTGITLTAAHGGAAAGSAAQRVANLTEAPEVWTDPVPTYLTGYPGFTSAHVSARYRERATDDWIVSRGVSGTYTARKDVTPEEGWGSRYRTEQDRDGEYHAEIEVTRNLRSEDLAAFARSHERFELELSLEGRQLGDGTLREGFVFSHPAAGVVERSAPASSPGRIEESLRLMAETNDAGDPPMTLTVTTPRDWSPFGS